MIDLHLHTNLSDGELTYNQLIDMLVEEKIKLASITDHNHSLVYEYAEIFNKVKLLCGCEMATSYDGKIVELLGYDVDYNVINEWYRNYYSEELLKQRENYLFNRLKEMCKQNNIVLSENLELSEIKKGVSKKVIYNDVIKNNTDIPFKISSYREFFRKELSNPLSLLYLNEAITYPSFDETVELIRKAKGHIFIAHPFEYEMKDVYGFIDQISSKIDGVEILHPSASFVNSKKLVDYCKNNDLYGSLGSDFHSYSKLNRVGVRLSKEMANQTPFSWLKKYIEVEALYE